MVEEAGGLESMGSKISTATGDFTFTLKKKVHYWEKWTRTVRLSTRNNYCVRQGHLNQERRGGVGDMTVNSLKGSMAELEKIGWDTKRWW